jgi:hypothetical protein
MVFEFYSKIYLFCKKEILFFKSLKRGKESVKKNLNLSHKFNQIYNLIDIKLSYLYNFI